MQFWLLRCCRTSYSRNFLRFGFSLFSVDSGDQKIKTFCTFFGFSAPPSAIYLGQATDIAWKTINYGREAAAFFLGPKYKNVLYLFRLSGNLLRQLENNYNWTLRTTTDAKRPLLWATGGINKEWTIAS